jgi:hypothetical protein
MVARRHAGVPATATRMTLLADQALATRESVSSWANQLDEVQSQLERLVMEVGAHADPLQTNVRACLDAFKRLRSTAPVQQRSQAQTEWALLEAQHALENAKAELAASNALSYQYDMLKRKR